MNELKKCLQLRLRIFLPFAAADQLFYFIV